MLIPHRWRPGSKNGFSSGFGRNFGIVLRIIRTVHYFPSSFSPRNALFHARATKDEKWKIEDLAREKKCGILISYQNRFAQQMNRARVRMATRTANAMIVDGGALL